MKICDLARMIPPEELNLKLRYGHSELELDFLCFDENYTPVAKYTPKDYIIVDLGCYQAAQCYYFKDFCKYIGVDSYDFISKPGYRPPLRFYTENTHHIMCTIERYLDAELHKFDLNKTYFIMSAVPRIEHDLLDDHGISNYFWSYPGCDAVAKGIYAEEIYREWKELKDDN